MKNTISRIFLGISMLLCAAAVQAGVKNPTTLCVENTKGEVMAFALDERPIITFKGTYVIVQAGETKLLKFRDLTKAYFAEEDPTAVNDATGEGESIKSGANTISFSHFKPLTTILVYTAGGTLVKRAQTTVSGELTISIQDLPKGFYVIKAGKTSVKLTKMD